MPSGIFAWNDDDCEVTVAGMFSVSSLCGSSEQQSTTSTPAPPISVVIKTTLGVPQTNLEKRASLPPSMLHEEPRPPSRIDFAEISVTDKVAESPLPEKAMEEEEPEEIPILPRSASSSGRNSRCKSAKPGSRRTSARSQPEQTQEENQEDVLEEPVTSSQSPASMYSREDSGLVSGFSSTIPPQSASHTLQRWDPVREDSGSGSLTDLRQQAPALSDIGEAQSTSTLDEKDQSPAEQDNASVKDSPVVKLAETEASDGKQQPTVATQSYLDKTAHIVTHESEISTEAVASDDESTVVPEADNEFLKESEAHGVESVTEPQVEPVAAESEAPGKSSHEAQPIDVPAGETPGDVEASKPDSTIDAAQHDQHHHLQLEQGENPGVVGSGMSKKSGSSDDRAIRTVKQANEGLSSELKSPVAADMSTKPQPDENSRPETVLKQSSEVMNHGSKPSLKQSSTSLMQDPKSGSKVNIKQDSETSPRQESEASHDHGLKGSVDLRKRLHVGFETGQQNKSTNEQDDNLEQDVTRKPASNSQIESEARVQRTVVKSDEEGNIGLDSSGHGECGGCAEVAYHGEDEEILQAVRETVARAIEAVEAAGEFW